MAINVSQSFHRTSANAVDDTLTLTKAQMLAVNDNLMPNKYFAVCLDDGEFYLYDKSATPNAETGKFKKYGGGHAVEDSEGNALTQRDTMQFGDGFNATDDSENEKTVVEPNLMTAADMDDVVTPLPSVGNKLPVLFDESGAERVIGWYKYANGTKKPVYSKTKRQDYTASTFPTNVQLDMEMPSDYAIVDVNLRCIYASDKGINKNQYQSANYYSSFYFNVGKFNVTWNINNIASFTVIGEVLYTKTTDTPNT